MNEILSKVQDICETYLTLGNSENEDDGYISTCGYQILVAFVDNITPKVVNKLIALIQNVSISLKKDDLSACSSNLTHLSVSSGSSSEADVKSDSIPSGNLIAFGGAVSVRVVAPKKKKRVQPKLLASISISSEPTGNISSAPNSEILPIRSTGLDQSTPPASLRIIHHKHLAYLFSFCINQKIIPMDQLIPILHELLFTVLDVHSTGFDLSERAIECECYKIFDNLRDVAEFISIFCIYCHHVIKLLGCSFLRDVIKLVDIVPRTDKYMDDLISAVDDLQTIESMENRNFNLPEVFIRPFRVDIDNRHEYEKKNESWIYNFREKSYDQLMSLFNNFNDRSSYKDASFSTWLASNFASEVVKLLTGINDASHPWFVSIFCEMLLFHGVSDLAMKARKQFSTQSLSAKKSSKTTIASTSTGYGNNINSKSSASVTTPKAKSSSGIDEWTIPEEDFPGSLRFFYRFIIHANNYSFSRNLLEHIFSQIIRLSNIHRKEPHVSISRDFFSSVSSTSLFASKNSPSGTDRILKPSTSSHEIPNSDGDSLTLCVLKLKILGKFLGLLNFFPQWTLSFLANSSSVSRSEAIQVDSSTPSYQLALEQSHHRNLLNSYLPLMRELDHACREGTLFLGVSWIVEVLKLSRFDVTFSISNPYKDVFCRFAQLHRCSLFSSDRQSGCLINSSNRLFVYIEIDNLWRAIRQDVSACFPLDNTTFSWLVPRNCLDNDNHAFCDRFNSLLTPWNLSPKVSISVDKSEKYRSSILSNPSVLSPGIQKGSWTNFSSSLTSVASPSTSLSSSSSTSLSSSSSSLLSSLSVLPSSSPNSLEPNNSKTQELTAISHSPSASSVNHSSKTRIVPVLQSPIPLSTLSPSFSGERSTTILQEATSVGSSLFTSPSRLQKSINGSPTPVTKKSLSKSPKSPRSKQQNHSNYQSPSLVILKRTPIRNTLSSTIASPMKSSDLSLPFPIQSIISTNGQFIEPSRSFSHTLSSPEIIQSLEASFWQQYPQFHKLYQFLTGTFLASRWARLKEKVVECLAEIGRIAKQCSLSCSENDLKEVLTCKSDAILDDLVRNSSIFVQEFVVRLSNTAVEDLIQCYPMSSSRVADLARYFIVKHAYHQNIELMDMLTSYAKRKVEETRHKCLQMFSSKDRSKTLSTAVKDTEEICLSSNVIRLSGAKSVNSNLDVDSIESRSVSLPFSLSAATKLLKKNKDAFHDQIGLFFHYFLLEDEQLNLDVPWITRLSTTSFSRNKWKKSDETLSILTSFFSVCSTSLISNNSSGIDIQADSEKAIIRSINSIQHILDILVSLSCYSAQYLGLSLIISHQSEDGCNETKYMTSPSSTFDNSCRVIADNLLICWKLVLEMLAELKILLGKKEVFFTLSTIIARSLISSLPCLFYIDGCVVGCLYEAVKPQCLNSYQCSPTLSLEIFDCVLKKDLLPSSALNQILVALARPSSVTFHESCVFLWEYNRIYQFFISNLVDQLMAFLDEFWNSNSYTSSEKWKSIVDRFGSDIGEFWKLYH